MTRKPDKRRSPRAPVSIRIDYSTVDKFFWDFARNINEGGLFVETNSPQKVGTTVQLKFYLPSLRNPIETTGEVVWVGTSSSSDDMGNPSPAKLGMGIQFTELKGESKAAINRLVRELKKK